jgi:hypothetical protein
MTFALKMLFFEGRLNLYLQVMTCTLESSRNFPKNDQHYNKTCLGNIGQIS